jgi:hypothetical protein
MKISLLLIFLLLLGCDGLNIRHPDMRNNVPNFFPVEELVYTQAMHNPPCSVNVFELEDSFSKSLAKESSIIAALNTRMHGINYLPQYQPWQQTPVNGKIYELSMAAAGIAYASECAKKNPRYKNLFERYANEEGAYFTYVEGDGLVLVYAPQENILMVSNWD